MTEDILIKLAAIVVVGVGAQWLAWRFRIPSILLLLLAGIFIGPITEFVDPDELLGELLIPIVLLSVGLILFEGGLTLRFADLPGVVSVVRVTLDVRTAVDTENRGIVPVPVWITFNASPKSPAVRNRSAGALARAHMMISSSSGEMVSRMIAGLGTWSTEWRAITAWGLGPVNGGVPASIS